jgi:hypothetical protein
MSQVEYDVDPGKEDKDEEDEQFVAVEDEPEGKTTDADEGKDDDDDEEEEEARLGGGREEDDDDQKDQRRLENKTRRARQRGARDRDKRELGFLRKRNEDLERRFSNFELETDARITGSEVATIDQSLNKARGDLALANQVIEQAIDANDGKNVTEAMNHRDAIRDNLRDLEQAKEYLSQERQAPPQPDLDPRHVAHAQSFMIAHDWWDPAGRDQDSQQVLAIDRSLVQEGFDPRNKDYWDELRGRVQQALPDHFEKAEGNDESDDDDDAGSGNGKQTQRRGGPTFRTGGRERALKKNEVYISPERREAMVEAGVWEDPVLRNKYLASYAKYDREQAETGA